jgi:hypothetical protein
MQLPRQNSQRSFYLAEPSFAATTLLLFLLLTGTLLHAAQVTSNPAILHFGSITIGQSETLPASLTNSESASVTISALSSSSGEFTVQNLKLPLVIPAGQTITFNVMFAPSTIGWTGGVLGFTNSASSGAIRLLVGGAGTAKAALSSSSSSLGFGAVAVGSTSTLPVTFTNSGTTGLVLAQTLLAGTGFSITGPSLPITLAPNQTATFSVAFSPKTSTSFSGSLSVPSGSLTIPLSGSGAGTTSTQLLLNPPALSFGSVDVGTSSVQPVTLSASGGAVTISSSASSSSQFALQGVSLPLTIASGQSVSFNVAFTPSSDGNSSGTLSLASNASDSNAQEALSGVGITAQSSVIVSWNASVSQVAGYNVYRGLSQGSYSKVNSTLNPNTNFTDGTVSSGQTYYYVATAVNSAGEESSYSAPVQAVIP